MAINSSVSLYPFLPLMKKHNLDFGKSRIFNTHDLAISKVATVHIVESCIIHMYECYGSFFLKSSFSNETIRHVNFVILCHKILMQHIFFNYSMFIKTSGLKWCSFNSMKKSEHFSAETPPLAWQVSIQSNKGWNYDLKMHNYQDKYFLKLVVSSSSSTADN